MATTDGKSESSVSLVGLVIVIVVFIVLIYRFLPDNIAVPNYSTKWVYKDNGTLTCADYCTDDQNKELPAAWKGAYCIESGEITNGKLVPGGKRSDCLQSNLTPLACHCGRNDRVPFQPQGAVGGGGPYPS